MLKWTDSKEEMELESKIADRAVALAQTINIKLKKLDVVMDIDAAHNNGTPLDLEKLLDASDADFAHDVFGIRSHIDRKTGKLTGCFLPRYALPIREKVKND